MIRPQHISAETPHPIPPQQRINRHPIITRLPPPAGNAGFGVDIRRGVAQGLHGRSGSPPDCSNGAPTDPDVRNSRIRLLKPSS